MRFPAPLREGALIRRHQRFLADVRLRDGTVVTAHCANPGSMRSCLAPGGRVWLSRADGAARKLPYTWEIAEVDGARIYVNPLRANALVAEAIRAGAIAEIGAFDELAAEVPVGRSRIDFLVTRARRRQYVEVKHATMLLAPRRAGFPDAVTLRGQKHLAELTRLVRRGHRALLLYTVGRTDARELAPADAVDPDYGRALRRAHAAGVELAAYRLAVSPRGVTVARAIPVRL